MVATSIGDLVLPAAVSLRAAEAGMRGMGGEGSFRWMLDTELGGKCRESIIKSTSRDEDDA